MTDEQKTETKDGELVSTELQQLTTVIAAIINPLAQQQSEVSKHVSAAEVEKFRIAHDTERQRLDRSYRLTLYIGAAVAAGFIAFFAAGKYEMAANFIYATGGALGGFGYGRHSKQAPQ